MLVDQRKRSAGCDMSSQVVTAAEKDILLTNASQVPSPKFYISGSGDVKAQKRSLKTRELHFWLRKKALCGNLHSGWILQKYCLTTFSTSHKLCLKITLCVRCAATIF